MNVVRVNALARMFMLDMTFLHTPLIEQIVRARARIAPHHFDGDDGGAFCSAGFTMLALYACCSSLDTTFPLSEDMYD